MVWHALVKHLGLLRPKPQRISVFLSSVSSEFGAYRSVLERDLTDSRYSVLHQVDFSEAGCSTLLKLALNIRACDAIVHIVGKETGSTPSKEDIIPLLEKHPDLPKCLRVSAEQLAADHGWTYTQWEAYLAIYYGLPLFVCIPKMHHEAETATDDLECAAQGAHLAKIADLYTKDIIRFESPDRLTVKVLRALGTLNPPQRHPLPDLQRMRYVALIAGAGVAVFLGFVILASNLGLITANWLGWIETEIFQVRMASLVEKASTRIITVTIDRSTPRRIKAPLQTLPLPRSSYVPFIEGLQRASAATLAIDLAFTDPGRRKEDLEDDKKLKDALATCAPLPVVLASNCPPAVPDVHARGGMHQTFLTPVVLPENSRGRVRDKEVIMASSVIFDPYGKPLGAILRQENAQTHQPIPYIALGAYLLARNLETSDVEEVPGSYQLSGDNISWPVGEDGELLVRWADPASFTTYEYSEAIRRLSTEDGRKEFKNKIVILGDVSGTTDTGTGDRYSTPVGTISGVEFVAQVVNTLLLSRDKCISRASILGNTAWSLILAIGIALSITASRRSLGHAGAICTLLAALFLPSALLSAGGIWIDTATPCLAMAFTFFITLVAARFTSDSPEHQS